MRNLWCIDMNKPYNEGRVEVHVDMHNSGVGERFRPRIRRQVVGGV